VGGHFAREEKEIEKLLKLTGVEKLAAQMENQMLANFKTQMPQVPEVFWNCWQRCLR
jgi:hypothetical protein